MDGWTDDGDDDSQSCRIVTTSPPSSSTWRFYSFHHSVFNFRCFYLPSAIAYTSTEQVALRAALSTRGSPGRAELGAYALRAHARARFRVGASGTQAAGSSSKRVLARLTQGAAAAVEGGEAPAGAIGAHCRAGVGVRAEAAWLAHTDAVRGISTRVCASGTGSALRCIRYCRVSAGRTRHTSLDGVVEVVAWQARRRWLHRGLS